MWKKLETLFLGCEEMNIEKKPETCGHSVNYRGYYICGLELEVCQKMKKCALQIEKEFMDNMKNVINKEGNKVEGE